MYLQFELCLSKLSIPSHVCSTFDVICVHLSHVGTKDHVLLHFYRAVRARALAISVDVFMSLANPKLETRLPWRMRLMPGK
jgi:hypothetical protein